MVSVVTEDPDIEHDLTLHLSDTENEDGKDLSVSEAEEALLQSDTEQDNESTLKEDNIDIDVSQTDHIDGGSAEVHNLEMDTEENNLDLEENKMAEDSDNVKHKKDTTIAGDIQNSIENAIIPKMKIKENDGGDNSKINPNSVSACDSKTHDHQTEAIEDAPNLEEHEDGDLLEVMDEKSTVLDDTEYAISVAQEEEQENEELLNYPDTSKSPSSDNGNHESEYKTDSNSTDDLMDIGENVIDIGDNVMEIDEHTPTIPDNVECHAMPEETEPTSTQKNSTNTEDQVSKNVKDTQIATNAVTDNDIDAKLNEMSKNESPALVSTSELNTNSFDTSTSSVCPKRGRGRPKKRQSLPIILNSVILTSSAVGSEGDSNKENVEKDEEKRRKTPDHSQSGVSTRSLRKRTSDMCDSDKSKKCKLDLDSDEAKTVKEKSSEAVSCTNDICEDTPSLILPENDVKGNTDDTITDTGVKSEQTIVKEVKRYDEETKESIRKLITDNQLKGLTRNTLESFVVQLMCESHAYKSQIASMIRKIKKHESTIDMFQKEIQNLSKQTANMHMVHNKVLQDLERFKKNSDKPLFVPKITRSVGLQSFCRENPIQRSTPTVAISLPASSLNKVAAKPIPANGVAMGTVSDMNVFPQTGQLVAITSKSPIKAPKVSPIKMAPSPNPEKVVAIKTANIPTQVPTSASVIDLTSDEDKKVMTATTIAQKFPVSNSNGQKFVIVNGQSVPVQIPSQNSFLLNNGAVIASTGTIVRAITPNSVLRTSNPINASTTPTNTRAAAVVTPTAAPNQRLSNKKLVKKHPAPFPYTPQQLVPSSKPIPPRPQLTLSKTECGTGIVLSWRISTNLDLFSEIASYQIYAYLETKEEPRSDFWNKIGDVKALQLPMAVTLTQFIANHRYYFAVRAVDVLKRLGPFSECQTI